MEEAVNALAERLRNEIADVERQLRKSRAARGADTEEEQVEEPKQTASPVQPSPPAPPTATDVQDDAAVHKGEAESKDKEEKDTATHKSATSHDEHSLPANKNNSYHTPPPQTQLSQDVMLRPVQETRKGGELLHLVRRSTPFGKDQWVMHYVVVDEAQGILWYRNAKEARPSLAQRPLGRIPFYRTSINSRGTRFMNAAVCWPLLLPEDCPQANDPTLIYFGIEYAEKGEQRAMCAFATPSRQVRDDWICFLTKYIALYLAPRPVSQALQSLPRGAATPRYTSHVIAGEAPGGTIGNALLY